MAAASLRASVDPESDFLQSLTDTSLYSIGAFFADQHPDLMDDVVEQSADIEEQGLERWAEAEGISVESAFQTLVTGLAVRYYRAVASDQH